MRSLHRLITLVVACSTLLGASAALAGTAKSLCVYDPSGANGDIFNLTKDFKAAASAWGVDFNAKPYTDEKTAAEDFKAGKCDAVVLTSTRVRLFHKFAGSLEAMGAVTSYDQLQTVVQQLSTPAGGKLLKTPKGLFPAVCLMAYPICRNSNY
jgi:hypothetical protein